MGAPDLRLPVDFEKNSFVQFDSGANQVYMKSSSFRAIYSRRKKQLQKRLNQQYPPLLCSRNFSPTSRALTGYLLRGHMTFNIETFFRRNL